MSDLRRAHLNSRRFSLVYNVNQTIKKCASRMGFRYRRALLAVSSQGLERLIVGFREQFTGLILLRLLFPGVQEVAEQRISRPF
jgi:hypothetical protein